MYFYNAKIFCGDLLSKNAFVNSRGQKTFAKPKPNHVAKVSQVDTWCMEMDLAKFSMGMGMGVLNSNPHEP